MTPLRLTFGATLHPGLLVTVLLPPLLFESALNMRFRLLRENWRPIAIYAVIGTLVSSFFVGYLSVWLLSLPLAAALVFGALISSTDPISVVAVFKQCKVGRRLGILVEGESLFNDGVSVVLYSVLLAMATTGSVTGFEVGARFVSVIAGGAVVGITVGLLASRVTREFDDPPLEITLTCLVAWGAFLIAEQVHASGVIATVVAGLTVDTYGMTTGMSPSTRISVHSFWEFASFLANSLVFLLLGIQETMVNFWGDLPAIFVAFCLVLAGRAVAVYALAPVVGGLPRPWLHIMVWSGLRGALAVALVSSLPEDFPEGRRLVSLTYGVVLFSLLGQGLSMSWVLRRLGLTETADRLREYRLIQCRKTACQAVLTALGEREKAGMPAPVVAEVIDDYRRQLAQLEEETLALNVSRADLFDEQRAEARKLALSTEKSAYREAFRDGLLEEEDLLEQMNRIDHELDQLSHDSDPEQPQPDPQ